MSSPLTILTSVDGKLATKRWYRDDNGHLKSSSYERAYEFRVNVYNVRNIRKFYKAIKVLESEPNRLVIRGVPTNKTDRSKPVLRRSRPDDSSIVWFEDYSGGLSWVMLDLDNIRTPAGTDLVDDPEGAIEYLIGLLPKEFWDVSCVWQLSSSAGMTNDDYISAHLFFWLDRPVRNDELKAWASQVNIEAGCKLIDPALHRSGMQAYRSRALSDRSGALYGKTVI